jgi:hypothetical protein
MAADVFALLEKQPPRVLAAFEVELRDKTVDGDMRAAAFTVACKTCGEIRFRLQTITRRWGDNESEIGLVAICSGCERSEVLFDQTRFGYDGEHDHLAFMSGSDVGSPLDGRTSMLKVEFVYNVPIDELLEHAESTGKRPQDFFDWVHVLRADTGTDDWSYDWECECA